MVFFIAYLISIQFCSFWNADFFTFSHRVISCWYLFWRDQKWRTEMHSGFIYEPQNLWRQMFLHVDNKVSTGHNIIINSSDEELTEEAYHGDLQSEEDLWVSVS